MEGAGEGQRMARIGDPDVGGDPNKWPRGVPLPPELRKKRAKKPRKSGGHGGHGGSHKTSKKGKGTHAGATHPTVPHAESAGVGEHVGLGSGDPSGTPLRARMATGGLHALDLRATGSIGMVLLDLVGEGEIHVGRVLEAWQREQDRIANRAWRRPGGLARMGGL